MKRRAYHLSKSKGKLNLRDPRNLVTLFNCPMRLIQLPSSSALTAKCSSLMYSAVVHGGGAGGPWHQLSHDGAWG
jgi:hypothetical protein